MAWRAPPGKADRERIDQQPRSVLAPEDVGRAVERRELRAVKQPGGRPERRAAASVEVEDGRDARRDVMAAEREPVGQGAARQTGHGDVLVGKALMLIAQAALECQARAHAPVVLREQRQLAVPERAVAAAVPLHVERGQAGGKRAERAEALG